MSTHLFTCFNPFYFCVEIKHCSLEAMTNTKWKRENLWIFYHKGHGCPSANKCKSAVWVGTWKHLRNAIVKAVKEWGLDPPSAFVPVATTHRKNLVWSGIQFFVSKPIYSGLVLRTVPFTEPFHTQLQQPSVQTLPHTSSGLATLPYSTSHF